VCGTPAPGRPRPRREGRSRRCERLHLDLVAALGDAAILDEVAHVEHFAHLDRQVVAQIPCRLADRDVLRTNHEQRRLAAVRHGIGADRRTQALRRDRHLRVRAAFQARHLQQVRLAEKVGDEAIGRALVHLERRADLLQHAAVQHGDQVRHHERLDLVVRDRDGGDAQLALQLAHLDLHELPEPLVEGTHRLGPPGQPRPGGACALGLRNAPHLQRIRDVSEDGHVRK